MLAHIHNKKSTQIFEASDISLLSSINSRPRFYNLSPFLGKFALNSYNISNFNQFFLHTYSYFIGPYILNLNLVS